VRRFINAMIMRASILIQWPNNGDLDSVMKKFERIRGIPQVCGVIDCIHVKWSFRCHDVNNLIM
jgi:hypothetical protein